MDNIKRFKRTSHHRPDTSIDGFIGGSGRGYKGDLQLRRDQSPRPSPRLLDDFRRPRPVSTTGAAKPEQPLGRKPHRDDQGRIDLDLPKAPKRRLLSPKRGRRALIKSFTVVFLIGLIGAGYIFGKGYLKAREIFKGGGSAAALQENADPSTLRGEGDGRVNILMLGRGGADHEGADLTDTIVIASIDPIHNEAALLSIPRDLYVQTNDYGSMKINGVFATAKSQTIGNDQQTEAAGLDALETTIEQTIGIPIHYRTLVDFDGFKQAIDVVGGIEVDVESPLYEVMRIDGRQYILNVKTGQQQFDGFRALAYARSRHTSPRGDFDRSERQRLIMVGLKEKVFSLGTLGNPFKINDLISAFGDHIKTNLSVNEMLRLYEIGGQINSSRIESVGLADPPNDYVTTANVSGLSVVIPRAGLNDFSDIQSFVRNKLRDGYLRSEDATVAVLNGTNVPGLAARTAAELESYGYKVNQVSDSPIKDQQLTTLVDIRNGQKKYTRSYLEKRFGVGAVSQLSDSRIVPGSADFVIILGQNEERRLQQ